MKILFLTNNKISIPLIKWIEVNNDQDKVILLERNVTVEDIIQLDIDFIISYSYKFIISSDILSLLPDKIINLHISFLPFNRGSDPNVWSFLENTKKGVTIHLVDKGIDTGRLIIQKEVFFNEKQETLLSSYKKLHEEIQALFKKEWENIKQRKITFKTYLEKGTFHYSKDFSLIKVQILKDFGWDIKIDCLKNRYKNLLINK